MTPAAKSARGPSAAGLAGAAHAASNAKANANANSAVAKSAAAGITAPAKSD
jgi:hypothetical protein